LHQNRHQFLKNPIKPKKTRFEVGFFRQVFFGFYWAGFLLPTLVTTQYQLNMADLKVRDVDFLFLAK
jgi:hypothetical protein